jgi:hypothetical protein
MRKSEVRKTVSEDEIDIDYRSPEELAGDHYNEMMQSEVACLRYLVATDYRVRVAAILICESRWKCSSSIKLIEACCEIANSNTHDSIRICAIDVFGRALRGSKSPNAAQFLADLIYGCTNSANIRQAAYWALRDIQFGDADPDCYKGIIREAKLYLRSFPDRLSENQVRTNLLGRLLPESVWESAEEIDWEFVSQFRSSQ